MKINVEFDNMRIPRWLGRKIYLSDKLNTKIPVLIYPHKGRSFINGDYYINLNKLFNKKSV